MTKKSHSNNQVRLESFDAVIFDMDGVLVNSEPHHVELEKENFRKLGLTIHNDEHKTYQGTATEHMWKTIKKKHGLKQSVEELVKMTNSMVTPYFSALPEIETMPGVEKLIKKLRDSKVPLALASSSFPEVIAIVLQKTGLHAYFDVVVNSLQAGASKPQPDVFLLAANKLNVDPAKCVVIEDSTNGILAAKSAGMYCIAYAGPGSELQDQSHADKIITSYDELL